METTTRTDLVLYSVADGVATITFNRPERNNAWTPEMGALYFDLLDRAAADADVRVIVVTGAGKSFGVGADMEILSGRIDGAAARADQRQQIYPISIPKPIIAAINGACAGISLCGALACDIRFAAAGAKFTTAFSRRGLIAEHGSSWILPRLVGPSRALDLLLSARVFLAEEAFEMGLVNRVAERESLMDEVYAYAKDMATNCSPQSLSVIKSQVWRHLELQMVPAADESMELMAQSLQGPDFREGVTSFLEKRPPQFTGISAG